LSASPPPAAYVPLDADHVRTVYLRSRGTRLWANQHVEFLPAASRLVTFAFRVAEPGPEHGIYEPVLIQPFRTVEGGRFGPTFGWCPKGGDHDFTPAHAACAHMVAADLEFATAVLPGLVEAGTWSCPHPVVDPDDGACVACSEVLEATR
jgi:hypothetical protein